MIDTSQIPPTTPAAAAPAIPSAEQIEQQLQQSGKLLASLEVQSNLSVDTSPLAALQPQNMVQTDQGPQPINLPSKTETPLVQAELATTHVTDTAESLLSQWSSQLRRLIKPLVALGLGAHSLWGLWESIEFILITYPELEAQLIAHNLTQLEVNQVAAQALVIFITTMVNMFLAFKIFTAKAAEALHIVVGIGLFFIGVFINQYLAQKYDLASMLDQSVKSIQKTTENTTQQFVEDTFNAPLQNLQPVTDLPVY